MERKLRPETAAIRLQSERTPHGEHAVPLYLTSSYVFDNAEEMRAQFAEEQPGHIYSRYANPSVEEFITKMAFLERMESGWATASGMAAIFTTFGALLQAGDHLVACRSVFGSTHKLLTEILPKWKIDCTYVDILDLEGFEAAMRPETKLIFVETPSNPALDILDLGFLSEVAHRNGALLVVDNCFATPVIQRPAEHGADIVIHSATKYLDGQGRTLGGVILSNQEIIGKVRAFARHTGPALSPFNAWVLSKSLETLALRMHRHSETAFEIARRLEKRSEVSRVIYPHLESHPNYRIAWCQMDLGGGIVSVELRSGLEGGRRFLDALRLFSLTANLGDSRSIATHPASTTHAKLSPAEREEVGISDGLVRLSIGLEHVEDIWEDLVQALVQVEATFSSVP